MKLFQSLLLVLAFLYGLSAFLLGLKHKRNPFGLSPYFNLISAFVWVDAVVFGLFFATVSLFTLITSQWILFWLIFAVFWTVRSIGEQVYWFHEQFTTNHRNPLHTLWPYKWFKGEEVWIVMQTFWQCCSVVSLIFSVYLFFKFLDSF
jgi:hypothetical protein